MKMPKSLVVSPGPERKAKTLKLKDIPVNQYSGDIKKEVEHYGKERLKRIWYDMATIREFEGMLYTYKTQGAWNGVEYDYKGPAHLSIGQEAASVGQCLNLGTDDYIFGSHRSHGEILAKCYSALWQLDAKTLEKIMKEFLGGETLGIAEKIPYTNVKDLAENFVLYGTLAEIFARKKQLLLEGKGPVLLETMTYRLTGHSPSDAQSYRTPDELKLWQDVDALESYGTYLCDNGITDKAELDALRASINAKLLGAANLAASDEVSQRIAGTFIEGVMFSNGAVETFDDRTPELSQAPAENLRVKAITGKARYGFDTAGKPVSKNKAYQYRDAIFEALAHRFAIDPTLAAWGEDIRDWGGAFAAYRGLTELLPYHRIFNSPIAEGAITGAGVGYAIAGGRAIVELMYCDFMGRAGDEIFNQAAKWQAMSAGILKMPLVIRVPVGNKYGAQHSQEWVALSSHIPGLKSYFPVTPYDAKGMLNLALRGTDPVLFYESQALYDKAEEFVETGVPEAYYEVPEGEPVIRKTGKDITIATLGATLYKAMEAAKKLQADFGLDVEVIDLRFINPLNYDKLIESVKKTGKFLLASDASERGSFLHTVANNLPIFAFDYLDAPVTVVGSRNWITRAAEMERIFFPQVSWLLDAIHEHIIPLKGYTPRTVQTVLDLERRNRLGV
jgi:2-oxoisovalerate dehydrogenase E1 component